MDNYFLFHILHRAPSAVAYLLGSSKYPSIRGTARFYTLREGVIVYTEVNGLPFNSKYPFGVFAYHIHSGESCTGNNEDPFANSLGHYNPTDAEHPYHAGDLPPLFGNYGFAWNMVFTARFKINEVIGKSIIIHSNPNDFTTQPAGNSGEKIACGIIEKYTISI
jgi:Cu-Zn family superoxide dismutase